MIASGFANIEVGLLDKPGCATELVERLSATAGQAACPIAEHVDAGHLDGQNEPGASGMALFVQKRSSNTRQQPYRGRVYPESLRISFLSHGRIPTQFDGGAISTEAGGL
jgi:hypothetical protein